MKKKLFVQHVQSAAYGQAYTYPTIAYSLVATAWVWITIVQTLQQGGQTRRDT
jgi:hypothetical protein